MSNWKDFETGQETEKEEEQIETEWEKEEEIEREERWNKKKIRWIYYVLKYT